MNLSVWKICFILKSFKSHKKIYKQNIYLDLLKRESPRVYVQRFCREGERDARVFSTVPNATRGVLLQLTPPSVPTLRYPACNWFLHPLSVFTVTFAERLVVYITFNRACYIHFGKLFLRKVPVETTVAAVSKFMIDIKCTEV